MRMLLFFILIFSNCIFAQEIEQIPLPVAKDILFKLSNIDEATRGVLFKMVYCDEEAEVTEHSMKIMALDQEIKNKGMIDLFIVRDKETEQVKIAIARVNRAKLNEALVKYYNTEQEGNQVHLGLIEIGDTYKGEGKLVYDDNGNVRVSTANDVTLLTLSKGDKIKLTNYQGVTINSQLSIGTLGKTTFDVLGRSGIALDIYSNKNWEESTQLKLDLGAGVSQSPEGAAVPTYQSLVKFEIKFY